LGGGGEVNSRTASSLRGKIDQKEKRPFKCESERGKKIAGSGELRWEGIVEAEPQSFRRAGLFLLKGKRKRVKIDKRTGGEKHWGERGLNK